jgi:hypothetical protein
MITSRAVPVLSPAHHRRVATSPAMIKMTLPTPWVPGARVLQERCLDPQITVGLLTDQGGFPLMVSATKETGPRPRQCCRWSMRSWSPHRPPDVTVVAGAGMVSEANQKEIETAGLSFILGMWLPDIPYVVAQWQREHPDEDIPER